MNRPTLGRVFWTAVIAGGLAVLYLKPVPLAYWVAQHREVLLGRYSVGQVTAQLILTPVCLWLLWGIWMGKVKDPRQRRQDAFKTISVVLSILLCVVFADVLLRVVQRSSYQKLGASYHRPPHQRIEGVFVDEPVSAFTYPNAPSGYPPVRYVFSTDARGFRNPASTDKADAVVLGDSFAEGSGVSDEQAWPVLLGQATGRTVYNLGMSGTSAAGYLEVLERFGLALKPRWVLCLLYEGNDFRDSNFQRDERPGRASLGDVIFKGSPLRRRIQTFLIRTLGPVGSRRFWDAPEKLNQPSHPMYPVSWLPLEVPAGSGHFYAFELKRVLDHWVRPEQFSRSAAFEHTQAALRRMKELCSAQGAELVVVYAPDKPHVLLQSVRDRLSAEQVRAFLALRRKNLPPAETLLEDLIPSMDIFEQVVKGFCQNEGIRFVSLTEVLRQKIEEGVWAYYTYDQHWSPDGHRIAADYLAQTVFGAEKAK
ncbi:MAG TPA: GDSL-type esterase/lipase family protein [Anaerohalosphaeraceae bacterium]|nr:GDSL-type esterase/lipase family protein [Anaerohalosphaeraceae bacterium]HOL87978.1 GDSL-type esterase/lipase family protein [Anaerohalosphaeraceae bacterium]HPP55477.1 GDSL-type esterase/lipase family protein [Anaerohalosphaeraceae bacterium]